MLSTLQPPPPAQQGTYSWTLTSRKKFSVNQKLMGYTLSAHKVGSQFSSWWTLVPCEGGGGGPQKAFPNRKWAQRLRGCLVHLQGDSAMAMAIFPAGRGRDPFIQACTGELR